MDLVNTLDTNFNDEVVRAELNDMNVTLQQICNVTAYWWPTMYGESVNSQLRYWTIGFDGVYIYTISGMIGGNVPTARQHAAVEIKSQQTIWRQAIFNIKGEMNKRQREEGYYMMDVHGQKIELTQRQTPLDAKHRHPEFMLANEYVPGMNVHWPLLIQDKLDGIRAMAQIVDNASANASVKLFSRGNKFFQFLDHITNILIDLFKLLPIGTCLDGELYRHGWTFNQISGIVKRTVNPHNDTLLLEYHIFDIILPNPNQFINYIDRMQLVSQVLAKIDNQSVVKLVKFDTVNNQDEILYYHANAKAKGYEGVMLRNPNGYYIQKRCNDLLKYKQFIEEEVQIVGVDSEVNMGKNLAMFSVVDKRGQRLRVRPMGTWPQRELWYQRPELVIGRKDYTIIHFGNSVEHDVQRIPIGKGFRDHW